MEKKILVFKLQNTTYAMVLRYSTISVLTKYSYYMTHYRLPLTLCKEITLLFTQVVGYIFLCCNIV